MAQEAVLGSRQGVFPAPAHLGCAFQPVVKQGGSPHPPGRRKYTLSISLFSCCLRAAIWKNNDMGTCKQRTRMRGEERLLGRHWHKQGHRGLRGSEEGTGSWLQPPIPGHPPRLQLLPAMRWRPTQSLLTSSEEWEAVRPDSFPCGVLLPSLNISRFRAPSSDCSSPSCPGTFKWEWHARRFGCCPCLSLMRQSLIWVLPALSPLLAACCQLSLLRCCCSQHRPTFPHIRRQPQHSLPTPADFIQPPEG